MPSIKKRAGKTTITLYAVEERQIHGAIESLQFAEINDKGPKGTNAGVLASGLAAWLKMLEPAPEPPTPLLDAAEKGKKSVEAEEKPPY